MLANAAYIMLISPHAFYPYLLHCPSSPHTLLAGDKVILTGAVAVVPDTSGLARVGEPTVSGKTTGRGDIQFGE